MPPLSSEFYAQSALTVARRLLGARLVRILPDGSRLSGRIVETEAYSGVNDMSSHAYGRRTKRNAPMWQSPGRAYVYLIYGLYWMLNVVTEPEGQPSAVLIRALELVEGLDIIQRTRGNRKLNECANGPARLTMALAITGALNEVDMTRAESGLWIEPDQDIPDDLVSAGPRVGLGKVPEPWLSIPWRWWISGNDCVSRGSGQSGGKRRDK